MTPPKTAVPRAVLDTNVIFSRVLHELFGRLAREARLFDLIWSDELLNEAKRTLIERKPTTDAIAERWVGYLREAFPDGHTDINALPEGIDLATMTADPDDQHVCALALAGKAQLLITFDDSLATDKLLDHGVAVIAPDAILAPAFDEQPQLLLAILERQAKTWHNRPLPDLLDAFDRAGVPDSSAESARVAARSKLVRCASGRRLFGGASLPREAAVTAFGMRSRMWRRSIEDCQVDLPEALGVGEDVHLDDPAVSNREAGDREQLSVPERDGAGRAVDERRPHLDVEAREADRLAGHVGRAPDHP